MVSYLRSELSEFMVRCSSDVEIACSEARSASQGTNSWVARDTGVSISGESADEV